jgi:predicted DNA-binding transcriptional regulator AlpA
LWQLEDDKNQPLMRQGMNKVAFTEKEASEYISMSRSYLRQDRMNGFRKNRTPGPHFIKLGRSIRYLKTDLDDWLMTHRVKREIHT